MASIKRKTRPKKKKSHKRKSSDNISSRRFKTAGDAADELYKGFNDWSSSIASHGMQAAYSIIAANWAVYGGANGIMESPYAKNSMAIIVTFIGLNLLFTGWMTFLYTERNKYANDDKERWDKEFRKEIDGSSSWPYTKFIENLGAFMRFLKVGAPVIAGSVFVCGLFS